MKKKYRYLYGPVPSRRLGRSLGVDLTPFKTCCQDCVFCQLGPTLHKTVERKEYVATQKVITEIDDWLAGQGHADFITLSGSGEPTLHERFGDVLDFIHARTSIPTVLLTSGALLHLEPVRKAASRADVVKVSLSAWDQSSFVRVNRPHARLTFELLMEGQTAFRAMFKGQLWMEVFLIKKLNSRVDQVARIARLADRIAPNRIHLNTVVRPPAIAGVRPLSNRAMTELCHWFHPTAEVIADVGAKRPAKGPDNQTDILNMLKRRPCTAAQIAAAGDMHINEAVKRLGKMVGEGKLRTTRKNEETYYFFRQPSAG